MHTGQVLHVLGAELAHELIAAKRLSWPECSPADMLHLVVRHVQPLRDRAVGDVLACGWHRLCAPESEQHHRLAQLRLVLFS